MKKRPACLIALMVLISMVSVYAETPLYEQFGQPRRENIIDFEGMTSVPSSCTVKPAGSLSIVDSVNPDGTDGQALCYTKTSLADMAYISGLFKNMAATAPNKFLLSAKLKIDDSSEVDSGCFYTLVINTSKKGIYNSRDAYARSTAVVTKDKWTTVSIIYEAGAVPDGMFFIQVSKDGYTGNVTSYLIDDVSVKELTVPSYTPDNYDYGTNLQPDFPSSYISSDENAVLENDGITFNTSDAIALYIGAKFPTSEGDIYKIYTEIKSTQEGGTVEARNENHLLEYSLSDKPIIDGYKTFPNTDGEWKKISTLFRESATTATRRFSIASSLGGLHESCSPLSLKNFEISKVDLRAPLFNGSFADGFKYWDETEGASVSSGAVTSDDESSVLQNVAVESGEKYALTMKTNGKVSGKVFDGETVLAEINADTDKLQESASEAITIPEGTNCATVKLTLQDGAVVDSVDFCNAALVPKIETNTDGTVTVSGNLNSANVGNTINAILVNPSYSTEGTIDVAGICGRNSATVNSDGSYSITVTPTGLDEFRNTVNVVVDGLTGYSKSRIVKEYLYENPNYRKNMLTRLAGLTNEADVTALLNGESSGVSNAEILGIKNTLYAPLLGEERLYVEKELFKSINKVQDIADPASNESLIRELNSISLFGQINSKIAVSTDIFVDELEQYADLFEIDALTAYTNTFKNSENKKALATNLISTNGYATIGDFASKFSEKVVLNAIKNAEFYSNVIEIMRANSAYFGVSFATFDTLPATKRDTAAVNFANYLKSASSLSGAASQLEQAVSNAALSGNSGGSGGSGGGGGGKVTTVVTLDKNITTQPENNSVATDIEMFSDLGTAQWAKSSIEDLYSKKIVSGYEDGTFKPNGLVSRAEFATMLVTAAKKYNSVAECDFTDVSKDSWCYRYVASLAELGVATGRKDGSFGATETITREDISAMVYRMLKAMNIPCDETINGVFADNDTISDYANTAVYSLKNADIISGMDENTFAPKQNATRAQAAKIISQFLKKIY